MNQETPRYKVSRPLGRGAYSVVFLAHDNLLDRDVALKVITAPESISETDEQQIVERLYGEARAAACLSHPNIVVIYDISRTKNRYFISMEFLEGETLRKRLSRQMKVDTALVIARQVLYALGHAHSKGIIHRDVKPENIFVQPDGGVKLADFGFAQFQEARTPAAPDIIVGTPGYIAPEIFEGVFADTRSDVFSFGIVFYEMLAGRRPFGPDEDAETYEKVMLGALSWEHEPPSSINPDVPDSLDGIIEMCLKKNPDERFQTVEEILRRLALSSFLSDTF